MTNRFSRKRSPMTNDQLLISNIHHFPMVLQNTFAFCLLTFALNLFHADLREVIDWFSQKRSPMTNDQFLSSNIHHFPMVLQNTFAICLLTFALTLFHADLREVKNGFSRKRSPIHNDQFLISKFHHAPIVLQPAIALFPIPSPP